jgi:hypothetical protein
MRWSGLLVCILWTWAAHANPTLSVDGACGERADFSIADATPGGDLYLLWGDRAGADVLPHGTCSGMLTDVRNLHVLSSPWSADAAGEHTRNVRLAPGFCGKSVQILDEMTCELSDRMVLPGSSVAHLECDYAVEFFNGSDCESHAELFNAGYAAGEADGYADGYWVSYSSVDATYEDGYSDAYATGFDEGASSVSLEGYYLAGFDVGYDDGLLDGSSIGEMEGSNVGFNHGWDDFYCDGEDPPDDDDGGSGGPVLAGGDLTDLYNSWESEGRTVYVFQSDPTVPIETYDTFCEERGMNWFVPVSDEDAQLAITTLYEYDYWHTWVITKNPTSMSSSSWGGFSVSLDSPSCVDDSDDGFSAIRKWGCSMCDPEFDSGLTRCWDSDHVYDWLVCEADPIAFAGYVYWDQDVTLQGDADQDAAMETACEETYPGSWPASIAELASARSEAPDINTSGTFLVGTCPDCEGATSEDAVDGHCRQCIADGDHLPYGIYPPSVLWDDDCCEGTQSAVCLSEPPCMDSDEDGVCDVDDICPADPLDDSDGDGSCDSDDWCPDDPEDLCTPGCVDSPQWTPVTCTTTAWLWSSDRGFLTIDAAEAARTLYSGCNHAGDNPDGMCSLDGEGWVSTDTFIMSGCDSSWYHLGGSYTGDCGGHDGDTVRYLVTDPEGCFDY